ncbi:MAG: hypothetical protein WCI12_05760 [Actinomycetes bacterium]
MPTPCETSLVEALGVVTSHFPLAALTAVGDGRSDIGLHEGRSYLDGPHSNPTTAPKSADS